MEEPSSHVRLLTAICEALPAVVTAGRAEARADGPGLLTLLRLVIRTAAAMGTFGVLLLIKLPCILAPVTDLLLNAPKVLQGP